MRRILSAAAGLAVLGLLAVWVLQTHPAAGVPEVTLDHERPQPQGGAYVVAIAAEPAHLNVFTTIEATARRMVLRYTHDALLEFDPDTGDVRPALAERVDAEGDGRSHVLQLREGVRFSDGSPVDMADVLFTWELARAGHHFGPSMWKDLALLESVEALDQRRLRLVLRDRFFGGLGLAGTSFVVVSKQWFLDAIAAAAAAAGEPAPVDPASESFAGFLRNVQLSGPGTGPYELARDTATGELMWRRGTDLLMVQNEHSWRRSVYPEDWNLAALKLLFVADQAARRTLLGSQSVDWVEDPDAEATLAADAELASHYDGYTYSYRGLGPVFVVWNHEREPFGDPDVRTALTRLFDREKLVELLGVHARPAISWFEPGTPREGTVAQPSFSVKAAGELLEKAGHGAGGTPLEVTILVVSEAGPDHQRAVDAAIPDFEKAGVTLRKDVITNAELIKRLRPKSRDFDAFVYAWYPDPINDPTEIFHSELGPSWMSYRSDEIDEALMGARAEFDPDKRLNHYLEFNRVFREDQPVTLLYQRQVSSLLHQRFQGVEVGAFGLSPRRWWVEPADRRYHYGDTTEK